MAEIKFIAELAQRSEYPPELAIGGFISDGHHGQNISIIKTGRPTTDTYWTDWGGTYDNPVNSKLLFLLSVFLIQTFSVSELIATDNAFYVDGDCVYFNTDLYPWQYPRLQTRTFEIEGYQSAVADSSKPSEIRYLYNGQLIKYPSLLSIPSATLNNTLSDPINGINLYKTFKITLDNSDGRFDDEDDVNFFNTPVSLYKTNVENPTLDDYKRIRYGFVENILSDINSLTLEVADVNRTLDNEVCREFASDEFPSIPSDVSGKKIPIAYGNVTKGPLFEVGTDQYVACDKDYLTAVSAVYNGNDESISFVVDYTTGIITVDETVLDKDAETCTFTGRMGKFESPSIGVAITTEIEEKGNIPYKEGPWDKTEADQYRGQSLPVNIYYTGGKLKDFVSTCLESDMAYLINKNDGRLTLRLYERDDYGTHDIDSWTITQQPKKTHIDQKYFTSSVIVNFNYNVGLNKYEDTFITSEFNENNIFNELNKKQRLSYNSLHYLFSDGQGFAERILERFRDRREVWSISTSYDTSEINILDIVNLEIKVNGRVLSKVTKWKVRQVNPAQDTLILEEAL
jgi:hypothetical protein